MKVLCVFGTRPEAIKMAPVVQELRRRPEVECRVCVTAQHRQMLDQVLHLFNIVPDYDLNVMGENQSPTQVAAAVLARLEPVLRGERPDWVLVQGDTTTVAAASLAAFYARVKVGHVEAGLRTRDKWQPFPEEINRRLAGVIADLHFAPTERARQNLLQEGVADKCIVVTGNPVIDALHWVAALPPTPKVYELLQRFGIGGRVEEQKNGEADKNSPLRIRSPAPWLILVTAHRRENFGAPLENICGALRDIAARYDGQVHIVYPVHLNPNVWGPVHRLLDGVPNITLTPPLDYLPMVHLMKHSYLVLTDSGGIQEEAPGLGKPVLVLREVTERPEAVEAGTVRVVGTDRERIVAEVVRLLEDPLAYQQMAQAVNPYGDGRAAQRIVSALLGEPVVPFDPARSPKEVFA
ncbi:non-hydrolyzing UDP-N-acetylglucosamine 2-epimerase [Thermoflexus sp.]|uniref:non-hydrolyzing UDP-N-acetylglucosamine 2-epimerase n=1 Tax=Thermoflexus sp. TaxID=1969742 RepID=UPI002ADDAAEF|nr:UDP-N-acetylglucosamine 2-epimerase (non-hydrolyzing) [Thermoflexus sp.]